MFWLSRVFRLFWVCPILWLEHRNSFAKFIFQPSITSSAFWGFARCNTFLSSVADCSRLCGFFVENTLTIHNFLGFVSFEGEEIFPCRWLLITLFLRLFWGSVTFIYIFDSGSPLNTLIFNSFIEFPIAIFLNHFIQSVVSCFLHFLTSFDVHWFYLTNE